MNSSPVFRRASIHSRPVAFAACAVLAAMLNAGAIGLVSGASSPWTSITTPTNDNPNRMAVVLIAGIDQTPEPSNISQDSGPTLASAQSTETRRRLPARRPTARTTLAAVADAPPQPVLFYPFREVDSPAFPESDWNLDIETLDRIGVQRLVFEVLVNDRGEVVGCTVLDPAGLADDVKRDLEKRLSETSLLPALRAGQLVASVRRIELAVASTPPELSVDPPAHRP